jgi:hypothetical protein
MGREKFELLLDIIREISGSVPKNLDIKGSQ